MGTVATIATVAVANPPGLEPGEPLKAEIEVRGQRALAMLAANPALCLALSATGAANEMFSFSPPSDPANDDEALQERVAIIMEGNGWDEATALREARWAADKERCWRAFLANAKRVLEAPAGQREGLLAQYQTEASGRYGGQTGAVMADGLRTWVKEGRVH